MATEDSTETTFAELLAKARALPPMTAEQKIEQAIDFAWGNCAVEWPTPPPLSKEAFAAMKWKEEWQKLYKEYEGLRADAEALAIAVIKEHRR